MAVNLPSPDINSILPIAGIRWGSVYAGIRKKTHDDLSVLLIDDSAKDACVAGVFTQNACCAAPVQISKRHLAHGKPRALLINAGCANAATGEAGMADALATCEEVASSASLADRNAVLPFSTGVILERLPMDKMRAGIASAVIQAQLLPCLEDASHDANAYALHCQAWLKASSAIMTTDTIAKIRSARRGAIVATGIAKGAGMIHPNMATMLGFVATQAKVSPLLLRELTREIADLSFNAITIDGDTSTNDSFVVIATGKGQGTLIDSAQHPDYLPLRECLLTVAEHLAQSIVRDGEGATKFVTIRVENAATVQEAMQVADKIALSPLVKTAFFASDPNLGRILAAIGNAGVVGLDFSKVGLKIGEVVVAEQGGRAIHYNATEEKKVLGIMQAPEFSLTVNLGRGSAFTNKYTCDYSYDYIKINAEYRT